METLPWLNKPGSRSIFSRLMGKAPPAAVERPPQQQYTSGQPFRQQVGQVMAQRTGPAQTTQVDYRRQNGQTVDVSRSGFVNPSQGDPPVANPFERRFPRPQTITAGAPMTQPLQQQSGLGRLITSRPKNADSVYDRVPTGDRYDTPYYDARRARNANGQGSPYIPKGEEMTYDQRREGYAAMAQNGGQSPTAFGPGHPLWGKTPDQARQEIARLQGLNADPNAYNAQNYVSPDGRRYDATPVSPAAQVGLANPIGTREVGGMEFSGGPGHPLWGKTPDQARQEIARLQGLNADPNAYNAQNYVSPDGRRYDATPVSPAAQVGLANPIGTREVGGMEFSGANRQGGLALANNRLPQAGNREEGLARLNMRGLGQTPTLQQAADDPNYNANGALFGGAKLGVNQNGQAFFREGPRPTDFAGNAQTAQEAGANRLRGLQQLEQRGVGYVDPSSGAFVGRDYQRFASDGSTQKGQIAGRLAAGGVTPTSLNQSQLDGNRLAMLTRMAGNREKAMARVQSLAQQSTAERRQRMAGPSPLDNLLRNNPGAALALQAQQQQQAGAERIAQLQNDGLNERARLDAENNAQRNQFALFGNLAQNGDVNEARRQAGLPPLPGAQQVQGLAAAQDKPVFFGGRATQTQAKEVEELKKTGTPQQVSDYLENVVGLTGADLDEAINEAYGSSFRTGSDPSWWGATGRALGSLIVPETRRGRGAGR